MDVTENYYALSTGAVVEALNTDPENGLDKKDIQQRLQKYGKNILEKKKQKSVLLILLEQFYSPIIWILIAAAILAFAFGEFLEAIAVIVVITVNTFIGFFMELQARRSMDKLRNMTSSKAWVIRNNRKTEVDSADIVPGDILHVESGDVVAADARIISLNNLAIKESALTGESDAVDKNTETLPDGTGVADRKNSIFKGTIVTRGNGIAIVVSTGDKTELGRIAEITHAAVKGTTPLNKKLNNLTRKLIWLTLFITLAIFLTGILRGKEWIMMIETAIALAIASIPEGLPVIATIALSRGMLLLAKKNVLVKSLESVQTLGETEIIFTDKTGTLTENEMYATVIAFHDSEEDLSGEESRKHLNDNPDFDLLQKVGVLCNNSSYEKKSNKEKSSGDPLEIALLRMAREVSGKPLSIQKKYPRIAEIPFDSELKMMGTINKSDSGFLVCVKGATEEVLEKCSRVSVNGKVKDLDDPGKWKKKVNELADKGWRVLSFAYRTSKKKPAEENFIKDLVFLGLVGFIDPPRSGIKKSINECRDAGIRVIMITGDHPGTANAIAKETGLVNEGEEPVTIHGKELMNGKISKDQRIKILNATTFARVDPAQKLDLITLYQQKKMVVAMTGDGVNDAPALKKADIGIAMGVRGTEAAKEAADLILKDDAFSSIVTAVKQGRVIFDNIRSFVIYLLSCNLSEILIVATASFFNMPFPLLPLQILFLNMVTDVFPALAIGMNKGEKQIMERKPRKSSEPIISKSYWISIIVYACCLTAGVIGVEIYAAFFLGLEKEVVNNVTFYTLLLAQLWHVFDLPEKNVSFFKNQITQNKFIWYALLLCIALIIVSYLIPQIKEALSLVTLEPSLMVLIIGGSFVPVLLVLLFKRVFKVIR